MPVRRHHSKSRYGCTQCKSRKLKCDESKPVCANCDKRNLDCSLETTEGSSMIFLPGLKQRSKSPNPQNQSLSPVSAGSSNNAPEDESHSTSRDRTFSFEDMTSSFVVTPRMRNASVYEPAWPIASTDSVKLIGFFNTVTWRTLFSDGTESNQTSLWLENVHALGQQHDFVFHSIMAVAALHMALTEPQTCTTYQASASEHHVTAITSSQSHIRPLLPEMVPSIFIFSNLMATYAFGFPKLSIATLHPIQNAHEILVLLRGTVTVAQSGEAALANGPFSGLRLPRLQNPDAALPFATEAALNKLATAAERYTSDEGPQEAYREGIGALWFTFLLLQENPQSQLAVLPFPALVPHFLLQGVGDEHPVALLMLAHYAVALHHLDGNIWQKGWGRWIVDAVIRKLGANWMESLQWPKEKVGSNVQEIHY